MPDSNARDPRSRSPEGGDEPSRPRPTLDRREFLTAASAVALAACGASSLAAMLASGCSASSPGSTPTDGRVGSDGAVADGAATCKQTPQPLPSAASPSTVVEVWDPKAVVGKTYDAVRVAAMVQAGLIRLAGAQTIGEAWKALLPDFAPSMRIGIKLNCLNPALYNAPEVIKALIQTLTKDLGATSDRIHVWDRRTDELSRSHLDSAVLGVKVAGTIASTQDLSGPGYQSSGHCIIDRQTHVSQILTQETDVTINVALLKTHNISGITGAMKNTYGCIDNPGDFHTGFNKYMPAIYQLDPIRKHLRLHITEALMAVTKGDTTSYPDAIPARLLFATDPVALDAHSLALVNTLRTANPNVPPLAAENLGWLDEAARLNLGTKTVNPQLITMP